MHRRYTMIAGEGGGLLVAGEDCSLSPWSQTSVSQIYENMHFIVEVLVGLTAAAPVNWHTRQLSIPGTDEESWWGSAATERAVCRKAFLGPQRWSLAFDHDDCQYLWSFFQTGTCAYAGFFVCNENIRSNNECSRGYNCGWKDASVAWRGCCWLEPIHLIILQSVMITIISNPHWISLLDKIMPISFGVWLPYGHTALHIYCPWIIPLCEIQGRFNFFPARCTSSRLIKICIINKTIFKSYFLQIWLKH